MTNGMIWLRHYSNKRTDPRVKLLSLTSKAVYYMLTEVAAQCDSQGGFVMNGIQLTDQQIAQLATVEVTELRAAMREMKKTGIVSVNGHGPYLVDFADEQVSQEQRREQWRERQQRKRDKERDVTGDTERDKERDVTPLELRVKSLESESLLLLSPAEIEKLKPGWSREAAMIAIKADKPATYVKGIMKNWIKEGRNANRNPETNRPRTPRKAKTDQPTSPTNTDREAARRALARRKSKTGM